MAWEPSTTNVPLAERDGGSQKPRGGAGAADIEGGRGGREAAIDAVDDERVRGLVACTRTPSASSARCM